MTRNMVRYRNPVQLYRYGMYGMYRYSCTENSSIEICLQNEKWAVINYIPLRFRASSLYVSPDDLTAFCHRMEQIQTELGPIERKNGTNRLQIPSVSPIQIWVIIYVRTPVEVSARECVSRVSAQHGAGSRHRGRQAACVDCGSLWPAV